MPTVQFQIIGEGLNKRWGPTDNLNINKWGVQIKRGGGLKNVLGQKWQPDLPDPAITNLYKTNKDLTLMYY